MKVYKRTLCGIFASLLMLSSCEKSQDESSRVEVLNVKESNEGNNIVLRGEIKYSKVSNDYLYTEEASGDEKIRKDKILNLIKSMTNEMAAMPEMAMLLDGSVELPCTTIERFRKNVLNNVDVHIHLESMGFDKKDGSVIQHTGQTRMTGVQGFSAIRYLVKDGGPTQAPFVRIDLQNAIFSNISITLLDSLNDSHELRATIAHELGHLFFEYAYPALAHSEKETAAGFVEGQALSEGAALLVEQTYLRKHYGYELGSSIFEKFHPFDNANAPYGKYASYFRDTFTEIAPGFEEEYPRMVTELLHARNNVIVSEIVLDHAETNKRLPSWKDCTTPAYLLVNQQNRVAGSITGYIRLARTEHSIAASTGKSDKASRSTLRCVEDIKHLEQDALYVNNSIMGRSLCSLFSNGDRIKLNVMDNVSGVNFMHTEVLSLFNVHEQSARAAEASSRTTSSIVVRADINISAVEPDYNKLLSDMKAQTMTTATGAAAVPAQINVEAVHKVIKSVPAITRNGNIIHELSHLYFARTYPTIHLPNVREGYAMYAEFSYYLNLLAKAGYNAETASILANDLMKLKYTLNTTVPTETLDALKNQYSSFEHFTNNYLIQQMANGLIKVNAALINANEGQAIQQRFKSLPI